MKITLNIEEELVGWVRKRAVIMGKSLDQVVSEHLQWLVGDDDAEKLSAEFERLSGKGDSNGWKWNHAEIQERR